MINDQTALQNLRDAWDFIRHTRNVIVGNANVATFVLGFNQGGMRDICFNLLLASALSVLQDTLKQLQDEGVFKSKGSSLGQLMTDSCISLRWKDYPLVDLARKERNRSIHDREYLPHDSVEITSPPLRMNCSPGAS